MTYRPIRRAPAAGGAVAARPRRALSVLAIALAALFVFAPREAGAAKRLYIANDDHTDYVWSGTAAQYRTAFQAMLDFYMSQAEATAANPSDSRGRFNCDCSLWAWEYEHARSAADFTRLADHLRAGDISMPLNPAVLCYGGSSTESVLRGMYYAGRLERRLGMRFPLVAAMENQTLPGGIASLWAGAGAQYSWRGVCGCASKTTFTPRPREIYQFVGPDGQGVTMKWNTQTNSWTSLGGYAEAFDPAGAVAFMTNDAGWLSRWPYDVGGAFGHGGDSLQSTTNAFVAASQNLSDASRRVIVSNETDFFQDFLASYGGQVPTFAGSFGNEWELYQASLAAVTADFRREMEKLRTAEALATVASLHQPGFMSTRTAARDSAFMAAGLFYEHDWTGDGVVPRATRMQFERDQLTVLRNYVDPLQSDALAAVASRVSNPAGTQRVMVFNPLSWKRTDAVDVTTTLVPPLKVVDVATGIEVASQVMSTGPTVVRVLASLVPAVGYRVYELRSGNPSPWPASAEVSLPAFDNGTYAVTLTGRGALASVIDHRDADREYVDVASGGALDAGFGTGTVTLESTGPVSTTLRVDAASTPPRRVRVTLYAGVDRIDVQDELLGNFSNAITYGTRFALAGATLRHEEVGMIAKVARAAQGGDYADQNARTDYLSFGHFLDFSLATRGVTVSNADASFFRAGNSTPTALDATTPSFEAVAGMQVDGPGLGFADQGGDTYFLNRFALRTHGAYDPAAAMRFALEHQNPLVVAPVTGGATAPLPATTWSLLSISSNDVLLWALKPAEEGVDHGVIARVWNLAEGTRNFQLSLPAIGITTATRTTHVETDLAPATVSAGVLADAIDRQQLRTYRLMVTPESAVVVPGPVTPSLALSVYPNPLGRTGPGRIAFTLPAAARARVTVRDLRGALVATPLDANLPAGRQDVAWDRRDAHGRPVRAGLYFVEVEAGGVRAHARMTVLD